MSPGPRALLFFLLIPFDPPVALCLVPVLAGPDLGDKQRGAQQRSLSRRSLPPARVNVGGAVTAEHGGAGDTRAEPGARVAAPVRAPDPLGSRPALRHPWARRGRTLTRASAWQVLGPQPPRSRFGPFRDDHGRPSVRDAVASVASPVASPTSISPTRSRPPPPGQGSAARVTRGDLRAGAADRASAPRWRPGSWRSAVSTRGPLAPHRPGAAGARRLCTRRAWRCRGPLLCQRGGRRGPSAC